MIRSHCLCRLFAHPKCSSASGSSKTRIKHFAEFRTFARNARPKQSHTCVTSRYLTIVSGKNADFTFLPEYDIFLETILQCSFRRSHRRVTIHSSRPHTPAPTHTVVLRLKGTVCRARNDLLTNLSSDRPFVGSANIV